MRGARKRLSALSNPADCGAEMFEVFDVLSFTNLTLLGSELQQPTPQFIKLRGRDEHVSDEVLFGSSPGCSMLLVIASAHQRIQSTTWYL